MILQRASRRLGQARLFGGACLDLALKPYQTGTVKKTLVFGDNDVRAQPFDL